MLVIICEKYLIRLKTYISVSKNSFLIKSVKLIQLKLQNQTKAQIIREQLRNWQKFCFKTSFVCFFHVWNSKFDLVCLFLVLASEPSSFHFLGNFQKRQMINQRAGCSMCLKSVCLLADGILHHLILCVFFFTKTLV